VGAAVKATAGLGASLLDELQACDLRLRLSCIANKVLLTIKAPCSLFLRRYIPTYHITKACQVFFRELLVSLYRVCFLHIVSDGIWALIAVTLHIHKYVVLHRTSLNKQVEAKR
jgi:hypothetical protein